MKNVLIKISIIIALILIVSLSIIYYSSEKVILTINGEERIILNLEDEYNEKGVIAKVCKFNKCKDITNQVSITGSVDTNVIGDYIVNYEIEYNNKKYTQERTISIVDSVAPIIYLQGSKNIQICPNEEYIEDGIVVVDNYDGDISNKVEIKENNSGIIYNVADSSNNISEDYRVVNKIDIEKPKITLNGPKTINLKLNDKYIEYGVIVTDNCDKISQENVVIANNVDTSKEGTYNVSYSVKDNSGNIGTVNRTIIVRRPVTFDTDSKEEYIENLEKYIKEKNYNISLGYVNLNTGYTYMYNEKVIYYGASLVKTVDALYVYEKMNFDEDTRKNVEQAISVSDNDSHRALVDKIGIEKLRSYGRSIGASNFLTRSNNDYFGNTTVKDQISIWKYLYNFINTSNKGIELKNYFINTYANFLLFDGIPITMHKYGYYDVYYHDVGIVYSDNPYIIVVLTKHGKGDYKNIVSDISKKIYELNKIDN